MNRRAIFAGLLTLTLMGGMVPSAMAEIFERTLILGPGAGQFAIEDLGVGDSMVLNLVNPTNQPLVFETTENLGNQKTWTVPANSSIVVDFTYTRPFDDDIEFVVKPTAPGAAAIATGVLIPRGVGERPAAVQQPVAAPTARPTAPMVRGFW